MRFETAIEHLVDNYRYAKSKVWIRDKVAWALYHTWKEADDRKTENCSEKPNNCEHITEDGVTCARYPACDDCPDNPLNKVKGSERFVKGSEQTEPTISKMEQVDKDINVRSKDEPQTMIYPQVDGITPSVIEPQTETEIAKAIVHKMIDDAVIAEDAYPDLRQKMHDAVDEYEPQTDCAWNHG